MCAGVVLLGLWRPLGLVLLACVPLLAWSRLRLARHSWVEVLGGSVLGALAGAPLLP